MKKNYINPNTEVLHFMGQDRLCQTPLTPPGGGAGIVHPGTI